ncbi:patatin-like phospholipase family protein [Actinospica sp.]|uniref:patatin-like phospholipase family protein n=1 Tax=Actinospica sp. TaxID=1872142 RepID=UPI002BC3E526|nr:patatin-like phospholipase family protein [Actinospica sp.]HWG23678.1 patatin-like phospholipase family protein [Actinospica sp.]
MTAPVTAFVLGGGGPEGASEVGMLRALVEAGIEPDLIVGTSVGAVNGAVYAAEPGPARVKRLEAVWSGLEASGVFEGSLMTRVGTALRTRTHIHSNEPLRRLLQDAVGDGPIEQMPVRFECVAASIERAAEVWFSSGSIVTAVLASSAVPGLLPPIAYRGEHFLDGGLVDSVPVGRAVELGADRIFILHGGRVEHPLAVPRQPWQVAAVAFEISRRHRLHRALADLPDSVAVHLLPAGTPAPSPADWGRYLNYRAYGRAKDRIRLAYEACAAYLEAMA